MWLTHKTVNRKIKKVKMWNERRKICMVKRGRLRLTNKVLLLLMKTLKSWRNIWRGMNTFMWKEESLTSLLFVCEWKDELEKWVYLDFMYISNLKVMILQVTYPFVYRKSYWSLFSFLLYKLILKWSLPCIATFRIKFPLCVSLMRAEEQQ